MSIAFELLLFAFLKIKNTILKPYFFVEIKQKY